MSTITGRKVASVTDLQLPGDFCFWHISEDGRTAYLAYKCPCGTDLHGRHHDSIPIKIGLKEEHYWAWDGDLVAPSITPSILRTEGCHWHGYFTAGVWQSV